MSVTLLPTTEHPSAAFAVASASLLMDHGPAQAPDAAAVQMVSKSISSSNVTSWGQNTQAAAARSRIVMAAARIVIYSMLCWGSTQLRASHAGSTPVVRGATRLLLSIVVASEF